MSSVEISSKYISEVQEEIKGVSNRNNSAELIRHPIKESSEPGFGEIFIQASSVDQQGAEWVVNIDSSDSTVILNEGVRTKYGLSDSVLVDDFINGKGEKKLVSGGTWVWIRDNNGDEVLSLMRRDSGAPRDAGCLTGPAGRCREKLSQTSVDETNQDFILIQTMMDGSNKLLAFYRNDEDKERIVEQKLRQIRDISESLMERYKKTGDEQSRVDADFLRNSIKDKQDIQLLKMETAARDGLDKIVMKIDGEDVDQVNGLAYMDEDNHTLEVREEVVVELPPGARISKVIDGGMFMRSVVLVKKEDLGKLLDDDLVPALRDYIERKAA